MLSRTICIIIFIDNKTNLLKNSPSTQDVYEGEEKFSYSTTI